MRTAIVFSSQGAAANPVPFLTANGYNALRSTPVTVPHSDHWRTQFDRNETATCVLDPAFTIVYCNPAWDRFALANNGGSAVASRICGAPLFRYVPRVLEYHYSKLFERAREKHVLVSANYECNSPDEFRKFCMHISPIPDTSLIAIEHSLLIYGDIPYPVLRSTDHDYGIGELVTMCAQCRRTKRLHDDCWDWVPEFLRNPPDRVSYGICSECLPLYCPDSKP
jgi:hypothetical protein